MICWELDPSNSFAEKNTSQCCSETSRFLRIVSKCSILSRARAWETFQREIDSTLKLWFRCIECVCLDKSCKKSIGLCEECWIQSYKQNSSVKFDSMLELTNQITHVTILASLIGQYFRVESNSTPEFFRIGSRSVGMSELELGCVLVFESEC